MLAKEGLIWLTLSALVLVLDWGTKLGLSALCRYGKALMFCRFLILPMYIIMVPHLVFSVMPAAGNGGSYAIAVTISVLLGMVVKTLASDQ